MKIAAYVFSAIAALYMAHIYYDVMSIQKAMGLLDAKGRVLMEYKP